MHSIDLEVNNDDPEIKSQVKVNMVQCNKDLLSRLLDLTTDWLRLLRIMGLIIMFIKNLKDKSDKDDISVKSTVISVDLLKDAECKILKMVQELLFGKEIEILKSNARSEIAKFSNISQLDVFIDNEGLLRVGGRLKNSSLGSILKHPVLLPKKHQVIDMIIIWKHEKVAYGGRGYTVNFLRNFGFWVINANLACRSVIFECVICRKLLGKLGVQKMTDLPKERTEEAPPFTYLA